MTLMDYSVAGIMAECALKLLVSNNLAGSIIGKGGSAISQLQVESGARLKLSQTNEFFPGTSDRIVLIQGTIQAILLAQTLILVKVQQVTDHRGTRHANS